MVLFLCHSDQIFRGRTSPTCECHGQFTQEKDLPVQGFSPAHRALRPFSAASLPLPATGPESCFAAPSSRSQGRVYRQAGARAHRRSSSPGSTATLFDQPLGGPVFTAVSQPTQRPWLNGEASENSDAKFIILLIVTCPRKWLKFFDGWSRSRSKASRMNRAN